MARDHARVNLAIWNDDDWLDLPPLAQHLYLVLWTHPDLSFAGVVDWRPSRLAMRAGGWTSEDVILAGKCLEARLFLVIDEQTEECLIRSWFRWDGLMKQPILAVSLTKARAAVSSRDIRAVIVHEAVKLKKIEPNLPGWAKPQVREMLTQTALDPRERHLPTDPLTPALTPALTPGLTPSATVKPGVDLTPALTPALLLSPSPSPKESGTAPADAGAKTPRGTRIPEPFIVTDEMVAWARRECPGLNHKRVTEKFVDYWISVPGAKGVKLDWPATWRNWLRREAEGGNAGRAPTADPERGRGFWAKEVHQ
jgi:hypothetical protein